MSRALKRKITVLNEDYFWVLDGNSIDGKKENHIRIHSKKLTKSILYLDPYNWHFEIKPKTIEKAILFAIDNGWSPEEKGNEMYLSMKNEGELYQLPEGIKFAYLDKNNIV
jgi:hypothetical protein